MVFPAKETWGCCEEGRATVHDQVRLLKKTHLKLEVSSWVAVAMCT